jgi:hypothetical protein
LLTTLGGVSQRLFSEKVAVETTFRFKTCYKPLLETAADCKNGARQVADLAKGHASFTASTST